MSSSIELISKSFVSLGHICVGDSVGLFGAYKLDQDKLVFPVL